MTSSMTPSLTTMVGRLVRVYSFSRTYLERHYRAERWYLDINQTLADQTEGIALSVQRLAAIVAVLSPRANWDRQLADLPKYVDGVFEGSYLPLNVAKATEIYNGADPDRVLSGLKVRAFWANLSGDLSAVTVDTWQARILGIERLTPKRYNLAVKAHIEAAKALQIQPAQLQSATWAAVRDSIAAREMLEDLDL